ncbi:MAG: methyltransferase domain-containing protein [Lewinellaceae bacterium]|nr:methyltransferase domain-containing protein [Lewinellaceae bacterium]
MYNPEYYWEKRLSRNFNLRGVGHQAFGQFYNYWLYKRKEVVLSQVLRRENLHDKIVLDVGTGTGFFIDWYLSREARISGIDISQTAVSKLRKKYPKVHFEHNDFSSPTYWPGKLYDVINAWDVIYHQVDEEAFIRFLVNVSNGLKEGGLFICNDLFNSPSAFSPAPHVRFRPLGMYEQILSSKGFHVKKIFPLYNFLNRPFLPDRIPKAGYNILVIPLFLADYFQRNPSPTNLSVSLWEKRVV